MSNRKRLNRIALVGALMMASMFTACKGLKMSDREPPEMPGSRTNFLPAKVAAFRHVILNQPDEEKRYGSEFYIASGVFDPDPSHVKVLVRALADMDPPVVEASEFYTRDANSRWFQGKPAIVWTSQVQRVTDDVHVFIAIGWMHSNLLYQFHEYEVRYIKRQDAWEVVDHNPIERPGS